MTASLADLVAKAEFENKKYASKVEYHGEIPDSVFALVDSLIAAPGKRISIPVKTQAQFDEIRDVFVAAARERGHSANPRSVFNDDDELTAIRITVGAKRGPQPKKS